MKLTIKTNSKFNNAKIIPVNEDNNEIYSIELDFEKSDIFSDLEFWLEDENENFNVSKRNKLQAHK